MKATKTLPEVKMCDATSDRGREREREKNIMVVYLCMYFHAYMFVHVCVPVCSDVREMHCLMWKIVIFWQHRFFSAATYPQSHMGQESVHLEQS